MPRDLHLTRAVLVALVLALPALAQTRAQTPTQGREAEGGTAVPQAAGPEETAPPPRNGQKILGQRQKELLIAKCAERPAAQQARCFTGS